MQAAESRSTFYKCNISEKQASRARRRPEQNFCQQTGFTKKGSGFPLPLATKAAPPWTPPHLFLNLILTSLPFRSFRKVFRTPGFSYTF